MPEVSNHGVRISYDVAGEGRPLVLLHGWAGDHTWWTEAGFTDALQRDYRVVIVDLRGHGASDKPHEPSGYRGEVVVGDVLAVVDAEGIARFALWGLSYGGWIAWMTAYSAPDRVAGLVTTGEWDPRPEMWGEDWEAHDERRLEPLRRNGTQGLVDSFAKEERDAFLRNPPAWARAMFLRADPQALLAIQSRALVGEGISALDDFPVPTLLIAGELEDEDDEAAVIAGMLPHGESLRLPGLGHADAGVATALVLPAVQGFLDRWFA